MSGWTSEIRTETEAQSLPGKLAFSQNFFGERTHCDANFSFVPDQNLSRQNLSGGQVSSGGSSSAPLYEKARFTFNEAV